MAAHESLGMQFPYPRVREAWARNYANNWATTITGEGNPVHPLVILPEGRRRAIGMTEYAMEERDQRDSHGKPVSSPAKRDLISEGFAKRHEMKKNYSSWVN
jgi:hypothetical protein